MKYCDFCSEPAAKTMSEVRGTDKHTRSFCYIHASEHGLLNMPVAKLQGIANRSGYATNGVVFVLESVIRADHPDDPFRLRGEVLKNAKRTFGQDARKVFSNWRMVDVADLAAIVSHLAEAKIIKIGEGRFLEELESPITLLEMLDAF